MFAVLADANGDFAPAVGRIGCERRYRDQHSVGRKGEKVMDVGIVGTGHRHQALMRHFPQRAEETEAQILWRYYMLEELRDELLVVGASAAHFEPKSRVRGERAFHCRPSQDFCVKLARMPHSPIASSVSRLMISMLRRLSRRITPFSLRRVKTRETVSIVRPR